MNIREHMTNISRAKCNLLDVLGHEHTVLITEYTDMIVNMCNLFHDPKKEHGVRQQKREDS